MSISLRPSCSRSVLCVLALLGTTTPANAQPGKNSPPPGYLRLAQSMSTPYSEREPKSTLGRASTSDERDDEEVFLTGRPKPFTMVSVVKDLLNAKHPAVKAAISRLLDGAEIADQIEAKYERRSADARSQFDDVLKKAASGGFKRTEQVTTWHPNSDGTRSLVVREATVDKSMGPLLVSGLLAGVMNGQNHHEQKYNQMVKALEAARLRAWSELLAQMDQIYPNHNALSPDLRIQLIPPNIEGGGPNGAFKIVNTGKQRLTNLTIVLGLTHFSTAPETTSLRVYFIPELAAGASIWMSTWIDANCESESHKRVRPSTAEPFRTDRWRAGAGGLIKMWSMAWANQGKIKYKTRDFPQQAEWMAEWQLSTAFHELTTSTRVDGSLPKRAVEVWAVDTAKRVRDYLPADSEFAKLAKPLGNAEFESFLKESRARGEERVRKMIKAGAIYSGDRLRTARGNFGEFQLKEGTGESAEYGAVALQIESADLPDGRVRALVFNPAQPSHYKRMWGQVMTNQVGRPVLCLCGAATRTEQLPAHFYDAGGSIALEIDLFGLFGRQHGHAEPEKCWYPLHLRPDDSAKIKAAAAEAKKLADQCEEPLKEWLSVKQGRTGTWQFFPIAIPPGSRQPTPPTDEQPITLNIENWKAESRTCEVVITANKHKVRRTGVLVSVCGVPAIDMLDTRPLMLGWEGGIDERRKEIIVNREMALEKAKNAGIDTFLAPKYDAKEVRFGLQQSNNLQYYLPSTRPDRFWLQSVDGKLTGTIGLYYRLSMQIPMK